MNIVLDDAVVAEAFKYSNATTKRELVDEALRERIARHKQRDLRDLRGSGGIAPEYDYKALRQD